MKTGRNVIIAAILSLSTAGAITPVVAAAAVTPAAASVAGPASPQTHFYV